MVVKHEQLKETENGQTTRSLAARLLERAFAPIDISTIVLFRIVFGFTLFIEGFRYWRNEWFDYGWVQPTYHFTVYGFGWLRTFDPLLTTLSLPLLGLSSLGIAIGFCYRLSATVFFTLFTYLFLLEQTEFQNHFYLVVLLAFTLIFLPAHKALSVDALLRPKLRSNTAPAWALALLGFHIALPYFYGGVAKISPDWLAGEPLRLWSRYNIDVPLIGPLITSEPGIYLLSYGGLFFDLLIVPLMLWRVTRIPAYLVALMFHITNSFVFNIGMFPWFMILATLLYFPPSWPRRVLALVPKLRHLAPTAGERDTDATHVTLGRSDKVLAIFIGAYVVFQILFPLRHFLYPGPHIWTEEGALMSWNMMLHDKDSELTYKVTNTKTGQEARIRLVEYITPKQYTVMSTNPILIHRFALHLAELQRDLNLPAIEVRVEARVSLNGRPMQNIIDPTIDLAQQPDTLAAAKWILPLTTELNAVPPSDSEP